jgi:large subunit ribosomal protein L35
MPKMKSHRSSAKRFRVTGTGKLMRAQAFRGHLNSKKSSQRKRRLDSDVVVHPTNLAKLALQLPYRQYLR